jgi:hypothetical protein
MSQFINSVAYQLYLWDSNINSGGDLGWQYYKDMAWGGLVSDSDGDFYQEFENHNPGENDQSRILDVIENEATNNSNSSGNGNECE